MNLTYHTYAKASLISGLFAILVQHQQELSVIATLVGILAGLVSLWKGLRGK